ncbi:RCC1 domain-containing protein [Microbacterium testaceum]|uniref:RCC1 domain-containing protein n=1 Tax=Microbacterium testaceum TaxID=2033 RepID=UPI002AC582A5|nr:hypothetical protein [Microbacterium testaceum]MDZ5145198.1 hypothetical protein [Microbacterium testaceum]
MKSTGRRSFRRAKALLSVLALLSLGVGAGGSTGAYFTAANSIKGNALSSATLSSPEGLSVVGGDNSDSISWSSATNQSWAVSNNVSSGVTYTLSRAYPNQGYETVYSGSGTSYTDPGAQQTALKYKQVSSGFTHTLGLTEDGRVYSWGSNNAGQRAYEDTVKYSFPTKVTLPGTAVQIEAGYEFSLALLQDGTVYAWGRNDYGQLGDGTSTLKKTPTKVNLPSNVVISSLSHLAPRSFDAFAVTTAGDVYAWGRNGRGQLGIGSGVDQNIPVKVSGTYKSVAAGDLHTLAIDNYGDLWVWGYGKDGRLGDGATNGYDRPTRISRDKDGSWLPPFTDIRAGLAFSLAVDNSGRVWITGSMFDDVTPGRGYFEQLSLPAPAVAIAAGQHTACAILNNQQLWCWGSNEGTSSLLGDGTQQTQRYPIRNQMTGNLPVQSVTIGFYNVFAITTQQDSAKSNVLAWGLDDDYQRGTGQDPTPSNSTKQYAEWVYPTLVCPSGSSRRGSYCTIPSGTTYSLKYSYLGWTSPVSTRTK